MSQTGEANSIQAERFDIVGLKSAEIVTDTPVSELINQKVQDVCLNASRKKQNKKNWSANVRESGVLASRAACILQHAKKRCTAPKLARGYIFSGPKKKQSKKSCVCTETHAPAGSVARTHRTHAWIQVSVGDEINFFFPPLSL